MAICYNNFGRPYNCSYSRWHNWGRWVLLGVVVAAFLIFFMAFACFSSRRRRRMGYQPYRGTAWTLGRDQNADYNQQNGWNNKQNESGYQPPPPPYGQDTVQPGTYQAPTAPPPVAQQGQGWYR